MKTDLVTKVGLAFVASIATGAILIGSPTHSVAADPGQSTQESTASVSKIHPVRHHVEIETAEERIKHLHDLLKITPAQESQWDPVAQVMLDNASAIDSAVKARVQKAEGMNAIDDLHSYQAIVAAHAEGLKKLATAFEPLYAVMPDAQQKTADAVFGHRTEPSKMKSHG